MSALGQKQTCAARNDMSASPPIATAKATSANRHVCFTPKSGHVQRTSSCLLWAKSGHRLLVNHSRSITGRRQRSELVWIGNGKNRLDVRTIGLNHYRNQRTSGSLGNDCRRSVELNELQARAGGECTCHRDHKPCDRQAANDWLFGGKRLAAAVAVQHDLVIQQRQ